MGLEEERGNFYARLQWISKPLSAECGILLLCGGSLLVARRLKKKLCNRRKSNTPKAIIKQNILQYQTTGIEILPITEPHEQDIAFALSLFTKEQTPHLH